MSHSQSQSSLLTLTVSLRVRHVARCRINLAHVPCARLTRCGRQRLHTERGEKVCCRGGCSCQPTRARPTEFDVGRASLNVARRPCFSGNFSIPNEGRWTTQHSCG